MVACSGIEVDYCAMWYAIRHSCGEWLNMPISEGCPCGAHVKSGYQLIDYLTTGLVEIIVDTLAKRTKFGGFLAAMVGITLDNVSLCDAPRPPQPAEFTLNDFVLFFPLGQIKFQQWIYYQLYTEVCECDDCPPATDCGEGDATVIEPLDGYTYDGGTYYNRRYHIPTGAEIWVARPDGYCIGVKNGLWVYFNSADEGLTWSVNVRDGSDGAPGNSWSDSDYGHTVTIYFAGEQTPPVRPFPDPPEGVADYYGPPTCTTDDLCTALDYVYTTIRRIEQLVQLVAGPSFGLLTPITGRLPGIATPITGGLFDTLPRLIEGIAPVQPAQLINPNTTPIDTSSVIDVTDLAYCNIKPTVVPAFNGYRGSGESAIYHATGVNPGLGWVVCIGQEGVLWNQYLIYPTGLEFPIPSTATDLALHLTPGVEVEVTTWEREV